MTDACLRDLGVVGFKGLDDVHHQILASDALSSLQGHQNQTEDVVLHRRAQKLTSAGSDCRPQLAGDVDVGLDREDDLDHDPFGDATTHFQRLLTAVGFQILVAEQREHLPLQGSRELLELAASLNL